MQRVFSATKKTKIHVTLLARVHVQKSTKIIFFKNSMCKNKSIIFPIAVLRSSNSTAESWHCKASSKALIFIFCNNFWSTRSSKKSCWLT